MFAIYATRTGRKLRKKENSPLKLIIGLVAKKYQTIYGKKGKPCILYDQNNYTINWRATERFIARYATKMVRLIPQGEHYIGQGAGRYASKRQIERMLDSNCLYASVNSIIIMVSILQLLQLSEDGNEFQHLCYGNHSNIDCYPNQVIPNNTGMSLAETFLQEQIDAFRKDPALNGFAPNTVYLADYILHCNDKLNELVGSNAYFAIRTGLGYPQKQMEIQDIVPASFAEFPA